MNKELTKPEQNLLAKLNNDYGVVISQSNTLVVNPYTQARVNTSPMVAALIQFAQEAYHTYSMDGSMFYNGKKVSIAFYDRVRYLAMKLDGNAYMTVLD